MKFTIDDKTLRRILIGVTVVTLIALILVIMFFRRRSKFEWPTPTDATGTDLSQDQTLTTALNNAQDAYNVSMIGINAMSEGAAKTAAILAAERTLSDAIDAAITTYVSNKCSAVVAGTKPIDATGGAAWDTYQTDLAAIGAAYYPVIKTATGAVATETLAARKADITGATRKYIATACPKFYKTSTSDPSTGYKNWTAYTTETQYTAATTPTTGKIGFAADRITATNISNWADYAAVTTTSTTSVTVAAGATTTGPITLDSVIGLASGDQIQFTPQTAVNGVTTPLTPIVGTIASTPTAAKTVTLTVAAGPTGGYIIPAKTVFAKALRPTATNNKWKFGGTTPNWKLARDAGPGTLPQPVWATA